MASCSTALRSRRFETRGVSRGRGLARRVRHAFTIIELLVVIVIVGLLVALTLAGVQTARESARRATCADHLRQIGLAMQGHHAAHRMFPPGSRNGTGMHVFMLPYMGQAALWEAYDQNSLWSSVPNQPVRAAAVGEYVCPSDPFVDIHAADGSRPTSYAGCYGSGAQRYGFNGVFRMYGRWFLNGSGEKNPVRDADIQDGLSNTIAISEILVCGLTTGPGRADPRRVIVNIPAQGLPDELDTFADSCASQPSPPKYPYRDDVWGRPWVHGAPFRTMYNHVLTPNGNNCINGTDVTTGAYTAASNHPGGVNSLFADGHVSFESDTVARSVWRALASRHAGD